MSVHCAQCRQIPARWSPWRARLPPPPPLPPPSSNARILITRGVAGFIFPRRHSLHASTLQPGWIRASRVCGTAAAAAHPSPRWQFFSLEARTPTGVGGGQEIAPAGNDSHLSYVRSHICLALLMLQEPHARKTERHTSAVYPISRQQLKSLYFTVTTAKCEDTAELFS